MLTFDQNKSLMLELQAKMTDIQKLKAREILLKLKRENKILR